MKRPQPYRLSWPVQLKLPEGINDALARQFTNADQMFEILFRDFGNTSGTPGPPGPAGAAGPAGATGPAGPAGPGLPVLTQGSIPFADVAGALTEDNTHLFFDATNKRVGIGVNANTPTVELDVQGHTQAGLRLRSDTGPVFLNIDTNYYSVARILYDDITNHLQLKALQSNGEVRITAGGGATATLYVRTDSSVGIGYGGGFSYQTGTLLVGGHEAAGNTPPSDLQAKHANINCGLDEWAPFGYRFITFGYFSALTYAPAAIGYQDASGFNYGDLIFATRPAGFADVAPTVTVRIRGAQQALCLHETAGTGVLHLPGATAAAGTAPIKLDPGVLLTTPEVGALEFIDNGTTGHLYITVSIAGVATRVQIV